MLNSYRWVATASTQALFCLTSFLLSLTAIAQAPGSVPPAQMTSQTWRCAFPAASCDASGLCIDLQTDPENCGHCGVSCGGQACIAGACASRWTHEKSITLGLNFGGLWGSGHVKSGDFDYLNDSTSTQERHEYNPYQSHWLLSGQVGVRRRWISSGFRLGVGHSSFSADSGDVAFLSRDTALTYVKDIERNLLRLGPFLDVYAYATESHGRSLAIYGEAALNAELVLYKTTPENPELSDQKDKFREGTVSIAPTFGVGVEVGVVNGLRVGLYGGVNISAPVEHFLTPWVPYSFQEYRPSTVIGGELRATLLYTIEPTKTSKTVTLYALLVDLSDPSKSPSPASVSAAPGYVDLVAGFHNVAVSAPKACRSPASIPVGRIAAHAQWCVGVINRLEGLLSSSGYNVVPWRSVPSSQDAPLAAAKQAGSDLLFQVNAAEPEIVDTVPSEFVWLRSDFQGHRGATLERSTTLTAHDNLQLDALMRAVSGHASYRKRGGATVELDVLDAASGRVIWKYRVERALPPSEMEKNRILVEARPLSNGARLWTQSRPFLGSPSDRNVPGGAIATPASVASSGPDSRFMDAVLADILAHFKGSTH
jgi:hypothetical protein